MKVFAFLGFAICPSGHYFASMGFVCFSLVVSQSARLVWDDAHVDDGVGAMEVAKPWKSNVFWAMDATEPFFRVWGNGRNQTINKQLAW